MNIKDYLDAGFSPATTLCLVAVTTLAGVVVFLYFAGERKRKELVDQIRADEKIVRKEREERYATTVSRIAVVEDHAKKCEDDRKQLMTEVAVLKALSTRCKAADCVFRGGSAPS